MRIVGGRFRGRRLRGPGDARIRPTADRVRESAFAILESRLSFEGLRVIDLFAGTGALGLEALSRGAAFALFVEEAAASRAIIRANVESLGLEGVARIWRRDAARLGKAGTVAPFDLAFADPPYGMGLAPAAAGALATGGWLRPGAWLVVEESARTAPGDLPMYEGCDRRRYGDVEIAFFRFSPGRQTGRKSARSGIDDQNLT